ncbi:MAG: hypothetical protein M3388_08820 [Acidobacteriota bacterium]|nr:hypothetical protein [Acidobacteriota bacterium]
MKWLLRIVLIFLAAGLIGLLIIYFINDRIKSQVASKIQSSITEIPFENPPRIAIVFGAKV